ncbi:hypothetical protein BCR34DRAFT_209121 [Clohesyomyces aquaticus]|uniref:Uncharacterized protein n=1 Tax=Clohesyomyces aquaticus TaxID=1231657 RepID=A0A1Y2AAC6_9PLEO|nr:hypothetical protein BCR34DRAFT_209121 [Clohesyomyces aquaticus]
MRILYALLPAVSGTPLHYLSKWKLIQARSQPNCGFLGNSDFYGLGIRIGIYLQWIASLLANYYIPEAVCSSILTNTIFLLAVFATLVRSSARGELETVEIVILLQLCYGFILSVLSIWGHRVRSRIGGHATFSLAGSSFRLALCTAVTTFSVWFWSTSAESNIANGCPTFMFLLAKIPIGQPLRRFYQVQSVVVLSIYILAVLWQCVSLFSSSIYAFIDTGLPSALIAGLEIGTTGGSHQQFWERFSHQWTSTAVLRVWVAANVGALARDCSLFNIPIINATICLLWLAMQFSWIFLFGKPLPFEKIPLLHWNVFPFSISQVPYSKPISYVVGIISKVPWNRITAAFNCFCLVWAIISVETTIAWNHIHGLYSINSTGQSIPFIIGIVSCLQTIYSLVFLKTRILLTEKIMQILKKPYAPPLADQGHPAGMNDSLKKILGLPMPPLDIVEDRRVDLEEGDVVIFWNRRVERRQSMDCLYRYSSPCNTTDGRSLEKPEFSSSAALILRSINHQLSPPRRAFHARSAKLRLMALLQCPIYSASLESMAEDMFPKLSREPSGESFCPGFFVLERCVPSKQCRPC